MICLSCKKTIPDDAQQCPHCGSPVKVAEPKKINSDTQVFNTAPTEKKPLYKAADIDPERPVRRIDEDKPDKPVRRRAPAVTAAFWILGVAVLATAVFGVCSFFAHRADAENDVPDASDAGNGQLDPDAGNETIQPDETVDPTPEVTQPEEVKPVYDIRGAWRWESETDGYRNTYWVFSSAGKLDIYLVGDAYSYAWPTQYEYDKDSYVLGLADTAMGLAWLDEDTFACGSGKAFRIQTSEIPDNAVSVVELDAQQPDEEEDPYLLPESNTRYLTQEDLEGLDKQQLALARNEIFARHGRLFTTTEIQEYFNEQSWYNGYIQPANFDSSVLNDYERYNVAFISQYEDTL